MRSGEASLFREHVESTETPDPLQALRDEVDSLVSLERRFPRREQDAEKIQSQREQIISKRAAIEQKLQSNHVEEIVQAALLCGHILEKLPVSPHPLADFVSEIVESNLTYIVKVIAENPEGKKLIGLITVFVNATEYGDEKEKLAKRQTGLRELENIFSREEHEIRTTKNLELVETYGSMLTTLIKYGNGEVADKAVSVTAEYFKADLPQAREAAEATVEVLLSNIRDPKIFEREQIESETPLIQNTRRLFSDIVSGYGLEPEMAANRWRQSISSRGESAILSVGHVFLENLKTLRSLEGVRPGAAAQLAREFHVFDFGRYPVELLVQQYDMRDNLELPYGLVLFPRDDHNGSFYDASWPLRELLGQTQGKYLLRAVECESKMDIARRLIEMDTKYGGNHKISFAIIGGHANENVIVFGAGGANQRLTIDDLIGKGVQRTSEFFEENPTVILWGCSAGKEAGIGQELSRRLDVKVIAPSTTVRGIKSIGVKFTDQKPDFNVKFETEGLSIFSRTKTYQKGKRV